MDNQPKRSVNTVLRRFFYGFGFVVVLLMLVVGIVGFTAPGARIVAALIERYASTPDQIVRITDPGALLTGDFSASSVTLFDSKGIYAEIRGLSVDWSPTALISGRFDANTLTAESIRLERLPVPSQETREVRSSFALPVDVRIGTLDARDILIGKDITGTDQHLTLLGNLAVTNASIAAKLAMSQPDRPQAKAVADLVFDPAANALKLDLDINEPKGGMIAKALVLPGDPAVDITISGDGPLSNWRGSATAALDGAQIVKLDGSHVLAQDGAHSVALTGGGTVAALLPPGLRPLFEGTTSIDLAAAYESGTLLRIERGVISTGALSLAASGTVNTQGENDLQASLTGVNGPIDLGMAMGDGTAHLLVNTANLSLIGNAATTVLDLGADLGRITLPQGEIASATLHAYSDSFDLTNRTGTVKTTLQTGATRFADANLDRLVKGPVKLDGTIGLSPQKITFAPLTLESASIGGTVNGDYDLTNGATMAALKLFALPATLPPALAGRFDTTIALAGDLSLASTGDVAISNLTLNSGLLQTAGSLAYENKSLNAALTGTVPDLGRFLTDAKGAATFKADITGPVEGLTITAGIDSADAKLSGRTLKALSIKADATTSGNRQDAKITATGTLQDQAIDIRTSLFAVNGKVSVPSLEAEIGTNKVTGNLELTDDFQPNGTLDFNLPDLGLIAAMAGQNATGDLAGSANIASKNGITAISVKADGTGITSGDLVIAKPQADITIADLKALAIRGTVSVETVAQGDNRLNALALDFTRQSDRTDMALTGTYDNAPLSLNGSLKVADGQTDIDLAGFEATPRGFKLKLAAPTTVSIANGAARLSDFAVDTPLGMVRLNGTAGQQLDLKANLAGNAAGDFVLPLSQGEARLGIQSADVSVAGTLNAAVIDVAAALRSVALPQGRLDGVSLTAHSDAFNIAGRTGALSARIETKAADLANADLARLATGPIAIDAALAVTPQNIAFAPVDVKAATLGGTLNGAFDMTASTLSSAFDFTVQPKGLPDAAAAKFDAPVRLTGNVATGPNGAVDMTNLVVDSDTLQAKGSAALADGKLSSTIEGTLPDLGKVLADASGRAQFTATASGRWTVLR